MKLKDPWHYPRRDLAQQILGLFETGLSYALIFFAPRRMGKTEFLRKDIFPLAKKKAWKVLYFSFLDVVDPALEFNKFITEFMKKNEGFVSKAGQIFKNTKKIQVGSVSIELNDLKQENVEDLKEKLSLLSQQKTLLLLDEVQTLAQHAKNENFIATLRTALDLHKDTLKVIFTGSSQTGLKQMFSTAKAPFFHFGQNLPFPNLERPFTDHLVTVFEKVTQRTLDKDTLWVVFQKLQKIPQLARMLVERLVLNPYLSIEEAQSQLISEVFSDEGFFETWRNCSSLEKLLLKEIALNEANLFSYDKRDQFAKMLGISNLAVSTVQSAIRSLTRKELIGALHRGAYYIENYNFREWLLTR